MSALILLIVLPALLALAAGWDLASYTIPNFLSLALIALFVIFALMIGLPAVAFGWHLAAGAVALVASFTLFAFRLIGGGDAKLFAATGLWFGFADLLPYAVVAALIGGALSLAILTFRTVPLPVGLLGQRWIARLHDNKAGVPYGVALATGALLVLPQAEIFRLLAHS